MTDSVQSLQSAFYVFQVEKELQKVCDDVLSILGDKLIKSADSGESKVFYHKM